MPQCIGDHTLYGAGQCEVKLSNDEHGRSEKVGLNTLANEATFRLIDEALTRGVNLTAVSVEA